jgi:hypothetical protein
MVGRSILFTGPEIRALREGRKTQKRLCLKPNVLEAIEFIAGRCDDEPMMPDDFGLEWMQPEDDNGRKDKIQWCVYSSECPEDGCVPIGALYGAIGDKLRVRETTVNVEDHGYSGPVYAESEEGREILSWGLRPDPDDMTEVEPEDIKLRPSARMPMSASRFTLEIAGYRIERLQDISEDDAQAEGCEIRDILYPDEPRSAYSYVEQYKLSWELIHGPGSWNADQWVLRILFKLLEE